MHPTCNKILDIIREFHPSTEKELIQHVREKYVLTFWTQNLIPRASVAGEILQYVTCFQEDQRISKLVKNILISVPRPALKGISLQELHLIYKIKRSYEEGPSLLLPEIPGQLQAGLGLESLGFKIRKEKELREASLLWKKELPPLEGSAKFLDMLFSERLDALEKLFPLISHAVQGDSALKDIEEGSVLDKK